VTRFGGGTLLRFVESNDSGDIVACGKGGVFADKTQRCDGSRRETLPVVSVVTTAGNATHAGNAAFHNGNGWCGDDKNDGCRGVG
jgi:hypothetical protein